MPQARKPPTMAQMQAAVDKFNGAIQVGESVLVLNDLGDLDADKTTSEAQILSGHTPVVMLEKKGMYLLDRVKKDPNHARA